MRIKLFFDDNLSQEFSKCWYFVGNSIKTVKDLQENIFENFKLSRTTEKGIQLEIDDFIIPSNQPIDILNQQDIVW
jgi:hypothetical protein